MARGPVTAPPRPPVQNSQPVANGKGLSPAKATNIMELESGKAWRSKWMPASFRNERFHVETAVRESGRRIVPHEFPKRELPYAEDMGRRQREFTVRGYIVVYPRDTPGDVMKAKNYIKQRDNLIAALETEGPAILQLPLLGQLEVACTRYRVTEENRTGGYCVFDMSFTEYGKAPATGERNSPAGVYYGVERLSESTISNAETKMKEAYEAPAPATPPQEFLTDTFASMSAGAARAQAAIGHTNTGAPIPASVYAALAASRSA